jgi:hypothetical protein
MTMDVPKLTWVRPRISAFRSLGELERKYGKVDFSAVAQTELCDAGGEQVQRHFEEEP